MQFCLEGWILPSPICDLHGYADYEARLLGTLIHSVPSVKAEENHLSPMLSVTESVPVQHYYLLISCTEFHANQSMNVEVWIQIRYARTHNRTVTDCTSGLQVLAKAANFKKFRQDDQSLTLSHRCADGRTDRRVLYTGCNRRNGPDFGRVFLMLNYTEIPRTPISKVERFGR